MSACVHFWEVVTCFVHVNLHMHMSAYRDYRQALDVDPWVLSVLYIVFLKKKRSLIDLGLATYIRLAG